MPSGSGLDLVTIQDHPYQARRAASRAGRDPGAIRKVYNIAGSIGAGSPQPFPCSVRQWIDQLSRLVTDHGMNGFVLGPPTTPSPARRLRGRGRSGGPREDRDMTQPITARADVVTDAPARYAKQLVSHLGRRVSWTTEGNTSTAQIGGGSGSVVVGDGVLTLLAEAPDPETLARVQQVLGSHLERFGRRNELSVTWTTRDDTPTGSHAAAHDDDQVG